LRNFAGLVVFWTLAIAPGAPSGAAPSPEDLVERERIRPAVERSLADLRAPADPSEPLIDQHLRVVEELAAVGPAVVPFLAAELDLPDPFTFSTSARALGRIGTAEAKEALRKALDVADREGGGFAQDRKIWCVYALAIAGEETALLDAAGGETPVDGAELMEGMRVADVAAVLTAPRSRALLAARIETLRAPAADGRSPDPSREERLVHAVRALGWVAGAESIPLLSSLTAHESVAVRLQAISALGRSGEPAAAGPVFAALEDPSGSVRTEAARVLHRLRPPDPGRRLLGRLEVEDDPSVRVWLYRAVAATAPPEVALEVFRSHRNRPDAFDRAGLARAIGETGSRAGLNLLRTLLRDPVVEVAVAAAQSIHRIGGEGAIDTVLALIDDPRIPVAQYAVEVLAEERERRAAPRIAESLLRMTARALPDASLRSQVQVRAEALVRLRYAEPSDDLRLAATRQPDAADRRILEFAAERLERIRANGDDAAKWIEAAGSSAPAHRALAYERLAEIGSEKALAGLLEALAKSSGEDEVRILNALASTRSDRAAPAFAERLRERTWDAPEKRAARAFAAWGARSIASPAMIEALEGSLRRSAGRDFATAAYLAVVAPERALPRIREVLPLRLAHYEWALGHEQSDLVAIRNELQVGRPAYEWDLPPDRFHRH
jgi:HEAT repeat protein